MANIDWFIKGPSFGNCNCDYSCPCQFEALPTDGTCRGVEALEITQGHFGETSLDGLRAAVLYSWPGPIFKGNGSLQIVIDEGADEDQRAALNAILRGEETDDGSTHWWVFAAMSSTIHDTLYLPITFECDIEARIGRIEIPGILETSGRPIKSPVTGEDHRVRIDIPGGIEFDIAEIGSATTRAMGTIPLDLDDTYGQFNMLALNGAGPIR